MASQFAHTCRSSLRTRQQAAAIAKACIAQERKIAAERHRRDVEAAIMLAEMRSELVTREANAARTADRFRILSERSGSVSDTSAYDRAVQTAESVESTIRALCCHPDPLETNPGTEMLRSDMMHV